MDPTQIMAPMRWIRLRRAFVVGSAVAAAAVSIAAAGCGFSAPKGLSGDASPGADAPGMDAPHDTIPPDGPPPPPIHTRRIDITDAQVTGGPHTDFPLLVSITAPWLRPTTAGGDVASASGFDLGFFADIAGTTRLAHEVEVYRSDAGNGNGALLAWVKLPSLAPTSELFLRYGDPAITASQEDIPAVWSNSFAAVWHLGTFGDSTANANTGTNSGSTAIGGQIAEARSFDGATDFVDLGSGASIDNVFTGGGTIEAWFRASGWGEGDRGKIIEKNDASTTDVEGWTLGVDNSNVAGSILFGHGSSVGIGGVWNAQASSVALNAWTHVAVVYDKGSAANNPSIFINGSAVTVSVTSAPGGAMNADATYSGRLGNRIAGDRAFNGRLDEVRVSRSARSPGWIATSHRNQSNPGAFYTVSAPL
jgi:hypothetical protein